MNKTPPTIDMQPDGSFRMVDPAPFRPGRRGFTSPVRLPFTMKLAIGAVLVGVLGISLAIAAAAVWVVSMLLPVIVIAGGVAFAAMKWRRWQLLRGEGGLPRDPDRFRQ